MRIKGLDATIGQVEAMEADVQTRIDKPVSETYTAKGDARLYRLRDALVALSEAKEELRSLRDL